MYPTQQKEDLFSKVLGNRRLLMIVGAVLIIVIIVSIVLTSGKSSIQKDVVSLNNQASLLESFASAAQTNIANDALRTKNVNAIIILDSSIASLSDVVGKIKIEKEVASSQAAHIKELTSDLATAKSAGTYDQSYTTTIKDELDTFSRNITQAATNAKGTTKQKLEAIVEQLDKVQTF
jgi:hypothetical protein